MVFTVWSFGDSIFDRDASQPAAVRTGAGENAALRPVPAEGDQARSRNLLEEVYSADMANTSPLARRALAQKLLKEAAQSADVASDYYVMLLGASHAAAEGGDLSLEMKAAAALAAKYAVDAVAVERDAAMKMNPNLASGDLAIANCRAAIDLARQLISSGDFAGAAALNRFLTPDARKDASLAAAFDQLQKEATGDQAQWGSIAGSLTKLRTSPDDPQANADVGRFYCFVKGDWSRGLPLLAKGADPSLRLLAQNETAPAARLGDADAIVDVAEDWWAASERETDPRTRAQMQLHSQSWYRQAAGHVAGIAKELTEKRLAVAIAQPSEGMTAISGGASSPVAAMTGTPEEIFKAAGLSRMGFLLIFPDESAIHEDVQSLRGMKMKLVSENSTRSDLERRFNSDDETITNLAAQLGKLNDQLQVASGKVREQIVAAMNENKIRGHALYLQMQDLAKQYNALPDTRPDFMNKVMQVAPRSDAVQARYDALRRDAKFQAVITKFNLAAVPKVQFGPSGNFSEDHQFLSQCMKDVVSADIPVEVSDGNVPRLEVEINGQYKCAMVWDSGAGIVLLTADTAERAGVHPSADDPTHDLVEADGRHVAAKVTFIKSLRVGAVTIKNVQCAVLPRGARGENLLGATFQKHFLARLDLGSRKLHLTPLDPKEAIDSTAASGAPETPMPSSAAPPGEAGDPTERNTPKSGASRGGNNAVDKGTLPQVEAGLVAEIFYEANFLRSAGKRLDAKIDFKWGKRAPDPAVRANVYSIRWTGLINAPEDGTYVLEANVNTRVSIDVDGNRMITINEPMTASVKIKMGKGLHTIRIDYCNIGNSGHLILKWRLPSAHDLNVIPDSVFWHDPHDAIGVSN